MWFLVARHTILEILCTSCELLWPECAVIVAVNYLVAIGRFYVLVETYSLPVHR